MRNKEVKKMENKNYVFVRNERGIPIIVPLDFVGVELPNRRPLVRRGYRVRKYEGRRFVVYTEHMSISKSEILSIACDAPSIERQYPEDTCVVKYMGATTVVEYVTPSGVTWCYKEEGGPWYHAMPDTDKLWREDKVRENRTEERDNKQTKKDKKNRRWRWASGSW